MVLYNEACDISSTNYKVIHLCLLRGFNTGHFKYSCVGTRAVQPHAHVWVQTGIIGIMKSKHNKLTLIKVSNLILTRGNFYSKV